MSTKKLTERFVIITNLQYVCIGPVRAHVSALLLEENESPFDRGKLRCRMRGFWVDPSAEIFDMEIPSVDFELVPAKSGHIFISDSQPEPGPLFQGGVMKIAGGGPEVSMISRDDRHEIQIDRFEGKTGDRTILKIWEHFPPLVQKYWNAPNIARVIHVRNPDCKF